MVASSDYDGVTKADLKMTLKNLVDHENGCGTTHSEQALDDCASGDPGEFSSQGYIRVRYSDPAPSATSPTPRPTACRRPAVAHPTSLGYTPASDNNAENFPGSARSG